MGLSGKTVFLFCMILNNPRMYALVRFLIKSVPGSYIFIFVSGVFFIYQMHVHIDYISVGYYSPSTWKKHLMCIRSTIYWDVYVYDGLRNTQSIPPFKQWLQYKSAVLFSGYMFWGVVFALPSPISSWYTINLRYEAIHTIPTVYTTHFLHTTFQLQTWYEGYFKLHPRRTMMEVNWYFNCAIW